MSENRQVKRDNKKSSIANEVIRTILSQSNFFFFYERIMRAQKGPKRKTNYFYALRNFCAPKKLLPLLFSVCLILFCWFIFACDVFLCAQNLFIKNRLARNCPNNLIYYTTDVYPYQPTYRASIYTHLFLFATICEDLFESSLIYDHLCESIFLILYENKQVCEFQHLKQMFYHQNTIMIFY